MRGDVVKRLETEDCLTRRQALQTAAAFMILLAGLARGYAAKEKVAAAEPRNPEDA